MLAIASSAGLKAALARCAAPDQFELPSGAPDAGHRQGSCGECADAPAGNGCRRLAEIGRLCRPPPAADGEADGARAFGGKLKAAGGRHGESRDLGDNGAKAAVPQAFLETDEDRLLIARLDIDHAIGHEPGLREGRGEEVLPGETPEHLAPRARRNSRRKERRGRVGTITVIVQSLSGKLNRTAKPRLGVSRLVIDVLVRCKIADYPRQVG